MSCGTESKDGSQMYFQFYVRLSEQTELFLPKNKIIKVLGPRFRETLFCVWLVPTLAQKI